MTVYFSDAVMKGVKCSDKVPAVKQVKRSTALQVQQNMQENLQKKIPLRTEKEKKKSEDIAA